MSNTFHNEFDMLLGVDTEVTLLSVEPDVPQHKQHSATFSDECELAIEHLENLSFMEPMRRTRARTSDWN